MCECCGGDCKLCEGTGGFYGIYEPIIEISIREIIDKDGCRLEELLINNKWKMTPTKDPKKPFRIEECSL